MRRSVVVFSVFIAATLAVFAGILLLGRAPVVPAQETPGHADLRGVPFESHTGQAAAWLHYPGELLLPGEAAAGAPAPIGQKSEYGTYRMRLTLPDNRPYTVNFYSMAFASRVFLNETPVAEVGRVARQADAFAPGRQTVYFTLLPREGEADITLQYANFYTGYDTSPTPPALSVGLPQQMAERQIHADLLLFSATYLYLGAFLLYLGIFLFHTARRENLFFALACLVLGVREGFVGNEYIVSLLPGLSWNLVFVLQFVFIGLLVILLFSFIIQLFPSLVPRRGARWFYAMCALFLLATLFTQAYMPYVQTLLFLSIGIGIMVYILVRLGRQLRGLPFTGRLSAFGVLVLFAGIFNDMFHLFYVQIGPIGRQPLLPKSMALFIFIQAISLFLQFMQAERALGKAKQKEAELAQQNESLLRANQQRAQFLSNVSHELKTPLTVVSNYAQLTRMHEQAREQPDPYIVDKMVLVVSEAERMALMAQQLIDIARIEEGRMDWDMQAVDPVRLVRDAMQRYYPVLNKNRNTLRLRLPDSLPPIRADLGRMEQVLINLVTNAIKFTSRGEITVSADTAPGGEVLLTVSDTGAGMAPEQLRHLFQRYYTGGAQGEGAPATHGTGLGLVISLEIVQAHGGRMEIDSRLGEGTDVRVYLPPFDGLAYEGGAP